MTLLPAYQRHLVVVMEQVQRVQNGEGVGAIAASAASQPVDSDLLVFLLVTVFNLLMLAWMIALMYRSYAYTTNMKGARPIVSFIVVLIIAEAVSKIGVQALFILVRP
jgi:hypothetical protein